MKISLNGKEENLREGTTVAGLINLKGLNPDSVIVEYNHELAGKETWVDLVLLEGDRLEILKFVGGG